MAEDDWERQERIARAKQLIEDAAEFQRESFKQAAGQAIDQGVMEALKEHGLTSDDWGKIYVSAPETTLRKQKEQAKKFADKLIRKATKGQRAPNETPGTLRQGGQRPSGAKDLSGIADARKGGKLSSEQALDAMIKSTLGDYFTKTMG